jgi:ferric-dicitrate binding protein FerR (iron transport regulator)
MTSDREQFVELLSKLVDGSMDSRDRKQLRELLHKEPHWRSEYANYYQIHALLHWQHASQLDESGAEAQNSRPDGRLSEKLSRWTWAAAAAVGAIAATVLLSMSFMEGSPSPIAAVMPQPLGFQVLSVEGVPQGPQLVSYSPDQRYTSDRIAIEGGVLRLRMDSGPVVRLIGPSEVEFLDSARMRMIKGKLTARVEEGDEKLVVETMHTRIVDLGTEFGVDLAEPTHTDVVVFEGAVELRERDDLTDGPAHTVLREGEAASINDQMQVRRIENVVMQEHEASWTTKTVNSSSVIHSVRDNTRDPSSMFYYRIVPGGMREDATAYVAKRHQWNSLEGQAIPKWLQGADLVETFGGDRSNSDLEIDVRLREPGMMYVMYHTRNAPPRWLTESFQDTGFEIGMEYPRGLETGIPMNVGAGQGRLLPFRVWQRRVAASETVTLGAPEQAKENGDSMMYGFGAKGLSSDDL